MKITTSSNFSFAFFALPLDLLCHSFPFSFLYSANDFTPLLLLLDELQFRLVDGRLELVDGKLELVDGKLELVDGKLEFVDDELVVIDDELELECNNVSSKIFQ
jgi:hypothetical protein